MPTVMHAFSPGEVMAYLDGELSPERALAVAQHLEQCRECRRLAEDFESVSARFMDWEIEL
ncbi:MAG TPA: zf-HC2 domain-containing protein, partial [Bryobacteraceae bacterium]|nr:zf-HC2 domain-containing protein [Bryobacteraceae bacterium]